MRSKINSKGFTFIEILILIVMASILLPAIIIPTVIGIKAQTKPEMATKAIYLAQQKMEEFMKLRYDDPLLNPAPLTSYSPVPGNSGYEWQWEIILVDNNLIPSAGDQGYKRILIRVKDPQNDTYEIYSLVTRYG